ncbi:MAG: LLM class flavin-dependent oxidoreductase [Actinomycetia bacterium]|nr:LLM class flavin-dependent oxidoreductase [Actinomycetes bacterium]
MALRFGMFDQLEHPGGVPVHELYRHRIGLAEKAEDAGFWGWHKSEHHMIALDAAPSPNVFLAAVIERTERIRVCSLVHLLPFYHPLRLVEELCMLDQLSEGRLEFGFGKGVSPPEHTLWGLDPDDAVPVMDEHLDIVLQAFQTEGLFSYQGRYHQFEEVPIEVAPFQQPHPPLWRPGTLETAARMGVRTMAGGPIAAIGAAAAQYRQQYDSTGIGRHHAPMIGGIRKVFVAPTDAEADEIGRRAWPAFTEHLSRLWWRYDIPTVNDPTVSGDFDRAKELQAVVVGSPETLRGHCDQFEAEAGTDYFVGQFAWGDLSPYEVSRSFDLFVEHVAAPLMAD